MDEQTIRQLKVADLRSELSKLGLPTTGKKEELVIRLLEAVKSVPARSPPLSPNISSSSPNNQMPSTKGTPKSPTGTLQTSATPTGEGDKLMARAARFGNSLDEMSKRKVRQERFASLAGNGGSNTQEGDLFDPDRLRARQARFGTATSSRLVEEEERLAKLKRLERFGLSSK